jgi:hypothetical protein
MKEVPIIREEQEALRVLVEPTRVAKALIGRSEERVDGGATLGVPTSGNCPTRLVQQDPPDRVLENFPPIDLDPIPIRVYARPQLLHPFAVHPHTALNDHLLGFPARCDARPREDFLEAKSRSGHSESPPSSP